jgi:hypothetical protein
MASEKTEVEGILPDDDHASFADRHVDEIYSLRSKSSIRSLTGSLQGLDLEYDRHSMHDRASTRSVTQWMEIVMTSFLTPSFRAAADKF